MSVKNTGELNRKISIQEHTTTINENGFPVENWIDIATFFAKVENTNGSKYFNANSEDLKKNTKFTIRYNSILNSKFGSKLRVLYNNKSYTVQYMNDIDEKHEFVEIVGEYIGS